LTPGLLAAIYQRPHAGAATENLLPDPPSVLKDKGGYIQTDDQQAIGLFPESDPSGNWWVPSGRIFYSGDASDTAAAEQANARAHFFGGCRYEDAFGNGTIVSRDVYDLLTAQIVDPVQNVVAAANDYSVLEPRLLTDPNGNQSSVVFDALGMVAGSAVVDKSVVTQQDSLEGFVANLTQAQISAFFADPRGLQIGVLLGDATSRIIYDLGRFARSPSTSPTPLPASVATIARETHVQDLGDGASRLQVSVRYSDGFGREIQRKLQAGAGPLNGGGPTVDHRWIGSGWTIWNNKGKPVRKYEPFFTATADFSFGTTAGVSSTLFYDPAGRVAATLYPDHSWGKVVFDPWRQESWDANDTVLIPNPSADSDVGSFFSRLPKGDYLPTWLAIRNAGELGAGAVTAAQKATVHANTPSTVHFDALARAFLTIAFNRSQSDAAPPVELFYRTIMTFDIESNQRVITDTLGRAIVTYDYNLLNMRVRQSSPDAGDRWMLNDSAGKPLLGWDNRNYMVEHQYDAARRPVGLWVQTWIITGTPTVVLAERTVYGEGQPNDQRLNLRGKLHQQFDAAGLATNSSFDFKGNLLSSSRALSDAYKNPLDWSMSPSPVLSDETFTSAATFDALNRHVTLTSPDGSVARVVYDDAGKLDQVMVNLLGAAPATTFVCGIEYNSKGQRRLIQYGNGVKTDYSYDPETFRINELRTSRSSDAAVLQDITYSYDPAGNITSVSDTAQQTIYFNNQVVTANGDYTYDALYRLISAAGREHIGQLSQPQNAWDDSPRMGQPLPMDGQAMRNYVERYSYDGVANIVEVVHQAVQGSWNRIYAYDEPNADPASNRLTSTSVGGMRAPYTYDPHGNITQMPHLPQMTWNFKDQLASTQRQVVNGAQGETTYYVYDASGQRVRKITESMRGTKMKERIYLGGYEVYREYANGSGTTTLERQALHIMDDDHRVAIAETSTFPAAASILRYQFTNQPGSVLLELDASGAIISYEEYYPYGGTSFQAGALASEVSLKRYRYVGKERDDETGCYYYGARYYSPWIGRWISCDPKGVAAGLNAYLYAAASPVSFSDRDGLQATSAHPEDTDIHQFWKEGSPTAAPPQTGIKDSPPATAAPSPAIPTPSSAAPKPAPKHAPARKAPHPPKPPPAPSPPAPTPPPPAPPPPAPAPPAPEAPWVASGKLTQPEIDASRLVFGDSIDYSQVTLSRDSVATFGHTSRTIRNTVNLSEDEYKKGSSELTDSGKETLIHELTHVWQFQHAGMGYMPGSLWAQGGAYLRDAYKKIDAQPFPFVDPVDVLLHKASRSGAYDWRSAVKDKKPWGEWNPEQQAEVVEDYYAAQRRIDNTAQGRTDKPQERPGDKQTIIDAMPYITIVRNAPR
jgi:RHS repeat-associated protein